MPTICVFACQEKACVDESVMLLWVENIPKPFTESAPINVVFLVSHPFCFHVMTSVVETIHDFVLGLEHISGGCTNLSKPLDVGRQKSLKNKDHQSVDS